MEDELPYKDQGVRRYDRDGVSKNTANASGALWEISCAKQEGVPILGIYVSDSDRPWILPSELSGVRVVDWTWDNIKNWLNTL